MGAHKGWKVRLDWNGSFRGEVWVPSEKRYVSKSFDDAKEAKEWARSEAGKIVTGVASPSLTAPRHVWTKDLAPVYTASLVARGRALSHLANIKPTLEALQVHAPDLLAPGAGVAIEKWLDGVKCAAATRNRKLVEVRSFMRWAMRRDLIEKDPARVIERSNVPKKLKPQFTLDELRTLLMHQHAYRKRFTLMVYAGLRSDEAAAITWGDLDLSGHVLTVRFHEGYRLKRGRERLVPLQDELLALLGDPGEEKERVAPTHRNNEREAFRDFLRDTTVAPKGRSPHSCRHTYAGLMTATGVPGPLLSAYLGHTSAATTMIYTGLASRYVQAVEHWGRGKLRICEGMVSALRKKGDSFKRGSTR